MFTVFKTKKYWGNIIKSATCFAEIVFEKIQSLPACVGDTFSSHKYAKGFPMALDLLSLWTVLYESETDEREEFDLNSPQVPKSKGYSGSEWKNMVAGEMVIFQLGKSINYWIQIIVIA